MKHATRVLCLLVVLGRCEKDNTIVTTTTEEVATMKPELPAHKETHDPDDHTEESDTLHSDHNIDYRTWFAASASILAISLCGIFGVLVVPIMHKLFYQHLIQFLIAMAVGTLVGDALIHLLPHALLPDHHHDHDHHPDPSHHDLHSRAVWMGCVAVVSMIGFFLLEKTINIVGSNKSYKAEEGRRVKVVREGHEVSEKAAGERKCMKKYSNYCVAEFDTEQPSVSDDEDGGEKEEGVHKNDDKAVQTQEECRNGKVAVTEKEDLVIISQHEVQHHGHSHAHSHLHSAPRNISSVAWMVIMGDGIHNMADGLAIGAAFASGFVGGVSTSVAVLCHELPHEIGDFAMLLKAGMTIKQAIFYNVLSSVLAFIGMVGGILLGTISSVTPWIFSLTAGIFLYVALVDMVPELSSGHAHPITKGGEETGYWVGVVLQFLGMSLGVSIMLVIALFEHKMVGMFGQESGQL